MKEGDLVLCRVEKVTNTITIVRLPDGQEGTMVSSEIAPGRIKHMRHYVVPNKQVVCKILEMSKDFVHLSLRRVSSKEKNEVLEEFKQEKAFEAALKQISKDDYQTKIEQIKKDYPSLTAFILEARANEKTLEKYFKKDLIESLKKIFDKKRKKYEIKQIIKIKCLEEDGIKRIKNIFNFKEEDLKIVYIAAGNFMLRLLTEDYKQGKKKIQEIIQIIEAKSKENNCEFFTEEDK